MKRVGTLTLNQNIDNFFNENEQLAFSVAHVVPGEPCYAAMHLMSARAAYLFLSFHLLVSLPHASGLPLALSKPFSERISLAP